MDQLQGFRTLIVAIVGGFVVPLAAKYGLNLTPDQTAWAVSGVMSLAMIAMRFVTKTPIGQKPPDSLPPPVSSTVAKALIPLFMVGLALMTVACKTTPTQNQQAALAVAIDLATGAAVQQGSSNPAVWKARAAQFEAAAKSIKAVNDGSVTTTLATLEADLQPIIAKLGPADVLAANALIAALTPILQQQLGNNPTAATTRAAVDIVLADIINACMAYTGA